LDEGRECGKRRSVIEQVDVLRIRQAIDETDMAILGLIERRLELAREIGLAKKANHDFLPMRPARESFTLKRLKRLARFASPMLVDVIWQELIGHGRQTQAPLRVVLFTSRNQRLLEECAERKFSTAIPIEWASSRHAALSAARTRPVIAAIDRQADETDLTLLGPVKTLRGEVVAYAYARITAED
jgi:chorismate mutase